MICPACAKPADSIKTTLKRGELVTGCENCLFLAKTHGQNDIARHQRQQDFRDNQQDVIQPFQQREYVKARGIDAARKAGASDEEIRLLY